MIRERFGKLTGWLGRRSPWLVLVMGGVIVLMLTGGIAAGFAWTNTESFCVGCHEMRDNPYAEFKGTVHDSNRTGVRAICADCHVPREPVDMLIRKIRATGELYGKLTGLISTPEKFEEHRYQMALNVWTRMKKTDSRECRNCHTEGAMDAERQSDRARSRHERAKRDGMTCIDCHSGIAHVEPDGPGPQDIDFDTR
jgi:cytochrome c-type protein NapC